MGGSEGIVKHGGHVGHVRVSKCICSTRTAMPVTGDEKGALSIAWRRKP
jgi:hypothetical protein